MVQSLSINSGTLKERTHGDLIGAYDTGVIKNNY